MARDRSLTFVVGETRIGKTTVLEKLEAALVTEGVLVGRYECPALADADPVLHCLRKLADRILSDPDVMAGEAARRGLSHFVTDRAGETLNDLIEAARQLTYVGAALDAVTAVRKLWATTRSQLDARINLAPPALDVDTLANALAVLGGAAPERKLVLIVDNLSGAVTAPGSIAASLLSTYIQQLQRRGLPEVHFVIGWKLRAGEPDAAYEWLKRDLGPYMDGAVEEHIGALSESDAINGLLPYAWFQSLSPGDQSAFVQATGRFPDVLNTLCETIGVPSLADANQARANYLAQTYPELEAALEADEHLELLYQLALAPVWPTYWEIERLSGLDRQEAHAWLEGWRDRWLLDQDADHSFQWRHETRAELVRRIASERLFEDKRVAAARQLLNHYLDEVGFESPECPNAPYYGEYARSLLDAANASSSQRTIAKIVADAIRGDSRSLSVPDLAALRMAPWNVRFLLWHLTLTRSGTPSELRDVVLGSREPRTGRPGNLAKALSNASVDYGNAGEMAAAEALFKELRALSEAHPEDAAVREPLAKALFNASVDHRNAGEMATVEALLKELRALAGAHPEDAAARGQLAKALVNASVGYRNAGGDGRVEALLMELRALAEANPEDAAVLAVLDAADRLAE